VKASIERAKGFEAKRQKLVWRGRALQDDATVASLNLHDNDHLILLVPVLPPPPSQPFKICQPHSAHAPTLNSW
jgi:hypothetical protein